MDNCSEQQRLAHFERAYNGITGVCFDFGKAAKSIDRIEYGGQADHLEFTAKARHREVTSKQDVEHAAHAATVLYMNNGFEVCY